MFSAIFASLNRIGVQNVVISGSTTYDGATHTPTLTGTPTSPPPTTSNTFTNAGTYTSSNMTIVPGAGYTLGTITGSYIINKATITGAPANPSVVYTGSAQTGTVITNVLPAGATYTGDTTITKTDIGVYTTPTGNITGTGNYQGTLNTGSFTITAAPLVVGNMIGGTNDGSGNASTSGTVTGGVAPYTITWTRISLPSCALVGFSGSPTSVASWQRSTASGTTTVQMSVTDNVGSTASNTTTIQWQIA